MAPTLLYANFVSAKMEAAKAAEEKRQGEMSSTSTKLEHQQDRKDRVGKNKSGEGDFAPLNKIGERDRSSSSELN